MKEFYDCEEAKKYLFELYHYIDWDALEWESSYIKDEYGKIVLDTERLMLKKDKQ